MVSVKHGPADVIQYEPRVGFPHGYLGTENGPHLRRKISPTVLIVTAQVADLSALAVAL